MPRSKFQEILAEALRDIPAGKVTTFKIISEAMGDVRASLAVRNECLKIASEMPETPWWRVVSSEGKPLPGAIERIREEGGLTDLLSKNFHSEIHVWPIFKIMARDQLYFADKLSLTPLEDVEVAAGVDVSYGKGYAVGTCVSLSSELEVLEVRHERFIPQVPYVPTYLAFRELRGMYPSSRSCDFDVVFVDGHGLAHPRRFGEASHLGLLLNRPSIGVAKSKLVGEIKGDLILLGEEEVGTLVNKGYVSPGYLTDVRSSKKIALKFWGKGRQPLPLILAHKYSKEAIQGH